MRHVDSGLFLSGSLDVLVERVWVHENAGRGIDVDGAASPTRMTLRGALVERNHEFGLFVVRSEAPDW